MSGMFRLPDEDALQALLRKSHLREHVPPPIVRVISPAGIGQPSPIHQSNGKAGAKKKSARPGIDYKAALLQQMMREGLPAPVLEYKFAEDIGRKWRIDIAYPERKIAIEIEGMAHRTRERFMSDISKYNELVAMRGWRLLRVYTRWITTEKRELDKAISLVKLVLGEAPCWKQSS